MARRTARSSRRGPVGSVCWCGKRSLSSSSILIFRFPGRHVGYGQYCASRTRDQHPSDEIRQNLDINKESTRCCINNCFDESELGGSRTPLEGSVFTAVNPRNSCSWTCFGNALITGSAPSRIGEFNSTMAQNALIYVSQITSAVAGIPCNGRGV